MAREERKKQIPHPHPRQPLRPLAAGKNAAGFGMTEEKKDAALKAAALHLIPGKREEKERLNVSRSEGRMLKRHSSSKNRSMAQSTLAPQADASAKLRAGAFALYEGKQERTRKKKVGLLRSE